MNFMEFACRGIVRNEDNIRRLSRNMNRLAKYARRTNGIVTCVCLCGIMLGGVIHANIQDTELLKKQVKDLAREVEELKNQKGA